ncbi:MAG: glutaredoxin family protein [Ramlibacter sp.]
MFLARTAFAATLMGLAAMAVFGVGDANAQQIYRIVGPDGRITFSDQPPLDASKAAGPAKAVALPGAAGSGNAALPFELREVASRYPVTLYSAPSCVPCGAGRAMLSSRGIPFAEKTVTTNDDIEALKHLSAGVATLPLLTIGGQQLRGFSEAEWTQFLDAAGYPKTSLLPPSYSQAPPAPLVVVQDQTAARPAAEAPTASRPPPPPPPVDNPAGIKF